MAIKVGRVPYLSFEPFYFDMERRGLQLCEVLPSGLAPAIEKGEIDAGPVPLADSFRLEECFQPVAGFCVSVGNKAGSNYLHSKMPIGDLGGARIGVADETCTSARLTQVLLSQKHRVRPDAWVSMEESYDAFLLTGDQALRRRRGVRGYPYKYDLGEEWHEWTGLPFVFARWLIRKDMDPKDAALLEDTLYVGLEEGVGGLFHLSEPREKLLMLARDVVEYILGYRYFIGLSEQKAIDLFRRYLGQLDAGG